MVSSLYHYLSGKINTCKVNSFKPYFRWSAPYTNKAWLSQIPVQAKVLNLILDGQLLIPIPTDDIDVGTVEVLNLILDGQLLIRKAYDGDAVDKLEGF